MPAQKRYSSNYRDEDEDESFYQPQHRRNQRRRGKQSRRRGGGGVAAAEQSQASVEEQQLQFQQEAEEREQLQQEEQIPNHDQESIKQSSEDDSDDESGTDPEEFDELISVSRSEIRGNVQCPICLGIIKRTRVVMGCQHRFCRECIDKSMRLGNNECPACRIHCASRRSLRDDPSFDALIKAIYPDVEKYEEEELVFHEEERALNQQIQASIAQICQRQSEALIKRRKSNKETITTSAPRGPRSYQNAYSRRRRRSSQPAELQQSDHNESEGDGPEHKSLTDEHHAYVEDIRENQNELPGHVLKPEAFSWGRGAMRSHGRYGSGSSSRNVRANMSNNDIPEHIAGEVKSQAECIEVKEKGAENGEAVIKSSNTTNELQILQEEETLGDDIRSNCHSNKDLTLGYMQKNTNICILD